MTEPLVEKAFAKINLTLRVLGRRADGYHNLESLVAFADLSDTLTLQPGDTTTLAIGGPYAGPIGPTADNLVLKAVAALRQRFEMLTAGHFRLEKNLPVAAGIGGGSADAAAALRLLAIVNGIALDDERLTAAALAVGADVPVCLALRPRIMRGVGEELSPPVVLPPLPAVLVNPGVGLATRDVFGKLVISQTGKTNIGEVPQTLDAAIEFLSAHGNDLTQPAIACVPVIAEVLDAMHAVPGVRLARMSGSGATCFALFSTAGEAAAASWLLQEPNSDWWVRTTTLG
ncbi:MAG TPA: 4-(cytidine 5'-diphospho)-2-C-methyl-D-erythritol kinase [Pseudolabrys sp.]